MLRNELTVTLLFCVDRAGHESRVLGVMLLPQKHGLLPLASKLAGLDRRPWMEFPEVRLMARAVLLNQSETLRKFRIVDLNASTLGYLTSEVMRHLTECPIVEAQERNWGGEK